MVKGPGPALVPPSGAANDMLLNHFSAFWWHPATWSPQHMLTNPSPAQLTVLFRSTWKSKGGPAILQTPSFLQRRECVRQEQPSAGLRSHPRNLYLRMKKMLPWHMWSYVFQQRHRQYYTTAWDHPDTTSLSRGLPAALGHQCGFLGPLTKWDEGWSTNIAYSFTHLRAI